VTPENKKGPDIPIPGTSSPFSDDKFGVGLALADSEHFRATRWAYVLGRRLAVLHGDTFGIFHFFFGLALNAICLHVQASNHSIALKIQYLTRTSQVDGLFWAK